MLHSKTNCQLTRVRHSLKALFSSCALLLSSSLYADDALQRQSEQLFAMSLEELMQVQVSLVDRAEEAQRFVPSAITVLTNQDIKLSGLRSLPELLRLVPGFNVRKIDSNKWAINSRRDSRRFADSMLILMDGRTLYNPMFGGTYWDLPDTILEDIERIEVIRGPGSSAWGANAITGVVNIVTKSALDTEGGLISAGLGRGEMAHELSARVAKQSEGQGLRVYGKTRKTDSGVFTDQRGSTSTGLIPDGTDAQDNTVSSLFGLRFDAVQSTSNKHMLNLELSDSESDETRSLFGGTATAPNKIKTDSFHFLYDGTFSINDGNTLNVLSYYDYSDRKSDIFIEERKIYHLEAINHLSLEQHQISMGGYVRQVRDDTENLDTFGLNPASREVDVYSLFIQDKWLSHDEDWRITSGLRAEHNEESGWEYNPSLRAAFVDEDDRTWWAAITRSIRTATRANADAQLDFGGGFIIPIQSADLNPVTTLSYELGLRNTFENAVHTSLSLFWDEERNPMADTSGGETQNSSYWGGEGEFSYRGGTHWEFSGSIAYLSSRKGAFATTTQQKSKLWSARLRSIYHINDSLNSSMHLYWDEGLQSGTPGRDFPNHTRLDMSLIWKASAHAEFQLIGTNLLDQYHYEFADSTKVNSAVRRGIEILARVEF